MATTTSEAIGKLKTHALAFDAIISNMSRVEQGMRHPTAGISLTVEARALGFKGPIYIFCSPENVTAYGAEAVKQGAGGATASPVQLFEWLKAACMTISAQAQESVAN